RRDGGRAAGGRRRRAQGERRSMDAGDRRRPRARVRGGVRRATGRDRHGEPAERPPRAHRLGGRRRDAVGPGGSHLARRGGVGLLGGVVTVAAGVAQAYTGFSPLAMDLSMPGGSILLLWALVVGVLLWRLAPSLQDGEGDAS